MNNLNSLTAEPWAKLHWQMSCSERHYLTAMLNHLQPKLSIEIGTYRGGSLQALSKLSQQVLSIDIDPTIPGKLEGLFHNVEFRTGSSDALLPALVNEINQSKQFPDLILVDGDHSAAGVCRDINALLQLKPKKQLVILLHDSFNPGCRSGMLKANWDISPFVQEVELDLVTGVFHKSAYGTAKPGSMWGGLAGALLDGTQRTSPLVIKQSQKDTFNVVKRASVHKYEHLAIKPLLKRVLRRV